MHLDFLNDLLGRYGIYAVFLLVMIEGDITLLLAGVLAHSYFFGDHSFAWVLLAGTLGGAVSDNIAYLMGREFRKGVRDIRFYRAAKPRMERLDRINLGHSRSFFQNISMDCVGPRAFFMASDKCPTCGLCYCRWQAVFHGS